MGKKRGNGEGSISKRKDGRWVAVVTTGRDPNTGKLKRRSLYGKTRQEVAEKLASTLNNIHSGNYADPSSMTLAEWLDLWLRDYAKPHLRAATWSLYDMLAKVHIKPTIGHIRLNKLLPHHLQKLYTDKLDTGRVNKKGGLSPRTVQLIHTVMHLALGQAIKEGLIIRNVSEATKLPKREPKEMRVFSLDEQLRFQEILTSDRLGTAFVLDLGSGLRRGELLALRWQDVDLITGIIKVNQSLSRVRIEGGDKKTALKLQPLKTKKSQRSIPLPDTILSELRKHKARQNQERLKAGSAYIDQGFVFCSEIGKPVDPRNFNRKFYQLLKRAGLERTNPHTLRHSYATRLLELNEHPKVVQELLGHANISLTLDTYSHVMPEVKQHAAEKLNQVFITKSPSIKEGNM